MHTRRQAAVAMATGGAPFAACAADKGDRPLSARLRPISPLAWLENADRIVKVPQCLIGFPDALRTEHLAISLHCDATRAYFLREGARLKADLLSGERRILLTHYARTATEVSVAVELLKLSDADYPVALMGAFALATKMDADLTVAHARLLIEQGGFEVDSDVSEEDDLTLAVIATQRAFSERSGIHGTPFIGECAA